METQGTPNQDNVNQIFNQQFGQQPLPNSTGVLVLGIISIVGCFCYGILGVILGIIALALSAKSKSLYTANPSLYTESSYKNMKGGRVCALIGLILSSLYLIFWIVFFAILGAGISSNPFQMFR